MPFRRRYNHFDLLSGQNTVKSSGKDQPPSRNLSLAPVIQLAMVVCLLLALCLFACPLLADVGYEPRPSALSQAGTGHGKPPHPIKILPRNTIWTPDLLAQAFGPNWSSGVPGAHSPDYRQYLESQFATKSARWLSGPDDPRYRTNLPLSRNRLGVASEWEVLYAYYTRDARVIPRGVTPPPPPPPIDPPPPAVTPVCPLGQTCQPFPPTAPVLCLPVFTPSAPAYATISSPSDSSPVDVWILPSKARLQASYWSAGKIYLLRSGVALKACETSNLNSLSTIATSCVYAWMTIPTPPEPK